MAKIPVSVCIIAKNEEKYIEKCLQKISEYGFEIVVTDTGSTDKTKEIAQKYADKVIDFVWIDDFSAARNFCAAQASNNWILALDCDEYVEHIDLSSLRIIMQKCLRYRGVLRLKSLIYTETGEKRYTSDDVVRFYNKKFFHFKAPVHEQIYPLDPKIDVEDCANIMLPIEVIHYGYLITGVQMQEKQKRNLKLLHSALEKEPENPYLYFQIGQSEFILGNDEEACTFYEKGLSFGVLPDVLYIEMMIESLATAYVHSGRKQEAQQLMEKYQNQFHTAKYSYVQANVYMDNNQPIKGLLCYVKATTMADVDSLGEGLMLCYQNIIELYKEMGNQEMVSLFTEKYQRCVAECARILEV